MSSKGALVFIEPTVDKIKRVIERKIDIVHQNENIYGKGIYMGMQ